MKSILGIAAASVAIAAPAWATIRITNNADLVTPLNAAGPNTDGTGIWFNPLTGYSELRGSAFPNPLFEDGKYFLSLSGTYTPPEALIYTEGLFSRGNDVIYVSSSNSNPKRFGDNAAIGPGTGYEIAGSSSGFSNLGPNFGDFIGGGHGYIGLTIRDATGANDTAVFYGYAEVTINPVTYAVTLNSFAYNDVRGAAITTVSTVPEPMTAASLVGGLLLLRRRRGVLQS